MRALLKETAHNLVLFLVMYTVDCKWTFSIIKY